MFGKFGLIATLSRNGQLELVADYNYIQTLVSFAIIVAGLEVYNLTNRSMANKEASNILAEIILLAIGAFISIALLIHVTEPGIASIWLISILLLSEQVSHDLFRKLAILRLQIKASIVLFARTGLWAYLIVAIELTNVWSFSLSGILGMWLGSSLLSIMIALVFIRKSTAFRIYASGWSFADVWRDVYHIARYTMLFFASGTISRLPHVVDKIAIREWVSLDVVGVYAVLTTISLGMQSIFESMIVTYKLPQFLQNCNYKARTVKVIRSFFMSTVLLYLFGFIAIWISIYQFTAFGPKLSAYPSTLILIYIGIFIQSIGIGPHLYFYANGKDLIVTALTISHPVIFFATMAIYAPVAQGDPVNIIPKCFLISYTCQAVLRYSLYLKFIRSA